MHSYDTSFTSPAIYSSSSPNRPPERTENWKHCYREAISGQWKGDISHGKAATWQMGVWEIGPALPPSHWWSPVFCQYIRFDKKLGEIKPLPWGQLYSRMSASPLPVIKLESAMMADNSVPSIINHCQRARSRLSPAYEIASSHLFSSLCHL